MLRAAGYEDGDALTVQSTDGAVPSGRELSFAWMAGTVMTGLTSILLMGAALYMAFLGKDTFSTPYYALSFDHGPAIERATSEKTDRLVAVTATKSDRQIIQASIKVNDNGVWRIREQPFDRIKATLATSATELADDIPAYDPVALLNRTQSQNAAAETPEVSTDIYGSEVEGEIVVKNAAMTFDKPPESGISDDVAAEFVRLTLEDAYVPGDNSALGYATENASLVELNADDELSMMSVAENVTAVPMTQSADGSSLGTSERIITIRSATTLGDALSNAGLTEGQIIAITGALPGLTDKDMLKAGDHLRILFGPFEGSDKLTPLRASIYRDGSYVPTAALTDQGAYVSGQEPPAIAFPENDVEEVNVNNLPSVYRSIWETGRKYGLSDLTIDRIVVMFAYDLDLTKRIVPGDSIELLQTDPADGSDKQLLYVGLTLSGVKREFFRYQSANGDVDFFDENGETGKRFLNRRPLQGGGTRIASRFGWRIHPISGRRQLHAGVDLASPYGTPIYASGDGVIERAEWVSGYGRYIKIKHVNGYETAYGHMSAYADGMAPGVRVRQGQVIGYVGSTGYSTGPHLHFEIRINGNPVDPLSVRLPRANTLPASEQSRFAQTVSQIRDLMARDVEPEIKIASVQN
ncbi:MAG: M23 family metallopeptidase [Hyphomicrobiaceae bacterium]|nr:M23 family metallopeptidase [Hyphomicrobiaceae bacterium]